MIHARRENLAHTHTEPRIIDHKATCQDCENEMQPQDRNKTRLRTTLSRSKSRKKVKKTTLGVMERTMYEHLDYYKTLNDSKTRQRQEDAMIRATLFPHQAELKAKPELNQKSKKLYEKIKRERRLSPNVFDRLKADEEKRSRSKVVSIVKRIKQVTPTKKITRYDLEQFTSPKEMKMFEKYLNLPPKE